MDKPFLIMADSLVEAARLGSRYAEHGWAVRLFTAQVDPSVIHDRMAAGRTDLAILLGNGERREAAVRAGLSPLNAGSLPPVREMPDPVTLVGELPPSPSGEVLLVGSPSPQARAVVEQLGDRGALVLTIPREAVLNQDESYLMGIRSGAAAAAKQGRTVVVRSENWPEALLVTRKLAERRGISVDLLEQRLLAMLGRAGLAVVQSGGSRKLTAIGSDTAAALCRALEVSELICVGQDGSGHPMLMTSSSTPLLLRAAAGSDPSLHSLID